MEGYIRITNLNDYMFCPKSIYMHNIYEGSHHSTYKEKSQYAGTHAHRSIDTQGYSTKKHLLQAYDIVSHEYMLTGVIDIFDTKTGILRERKKKVTKLYQGYIYQVYAQYLCLTEMGYVVNKIYIYSKDDNTKYPIPIPSLAQIKTFEEYLMTCRGFDPSDTSFTQNPKKCGACIYRELCDTYLSQ